MERTNVISFLAKLEAEKLPTIKTLFIKCFKDKGCLNIDSENYKRLSFYLYWLFRYRLKYISNNNTGSNFWLCYEYDKSYLWSIVEDAFIKDLLYLILSPITHSNIDYFFLALYDDLCQRLKLNLEFERLSLNWVLNYNIYTDLITGNGHLCDEYHSVFEVINNKTYDSLIVLDKNHLTLTIEEQISFILNKLRNLL